MEVKRPNKAKIVKFLKTRPDLVRISQEWSEVEWSRLEQTGANWSRLEQTGADWSGEGQSKTKIKPCKAWGVRVLGNLLDWLCPKARNRAES